VTVLREGAGSQWDKSLVRLFTESVVDPDRGLRFEVPDLLRRFDQRLSPSLLPARTA
jgi:hypothetical protein